MNKRISALAAFLTFSVASVLSGCSGNGGYDLDMTKACEIVGHHQTDLFMFTKNLDRHLIEPSFDPAAAMRMWVVMQIASYDIRNPKAEAFAMQYADYWKLLYTDIKSNGGKVPGPLDYEKPSSGELSSIRTICAVQQLPIE